MRRASVVFLISVAGCAVVGPASIRGSRMAYNEAIVATNDQQVLAMIVRIRYGESAGLLAVSSVTASMRIEANAGGEVGIGPGRNYAGNLVPLSIGGAYEENPTISYAPVQGEKYLRQVLSPLPIDLTVLLLNTLRDSHRAMTLLIGAINGIKNPAFLRNPDDEVDPRFASLCDLLSDMGRDGDILWVTGADGPVLVIRSEDETAARIRALFELLGIEPPAPAGGVITLPVTLGVGRPARPAVNIETRSLWDLVAIAAVSVEVPESDVASGLALPVPPPGPAGRSIRIRSSKSSPDDAATAIRIHDRWYFIEATDAESKQTFRILQTLLSARLADAADHERAAPVLTVPVSR